MKQNIQDEARETMGVGARLCMILETLLRALDFITYMQNHRRFVSRGLMPKLEFKIITVALYAG